MKNKLLWIGLLLAFPPMLAWALRGHDAGKPLASSAMTDIVKTGNVRIPVQVVAKDGKTEWKMVEVPAEPTPERSRF